MRNQKLVKGDWNAEYEEGYDILTFQNKSQLIEAIYEVYSFIWDNYPDIEFQRSDVFIFKETTSEGKYKEAKNYFQSNPVNGFNQELFVVLNNGASKMVHGITFSHYHFSDATGVYVKFQ
ncbi:hypothetical protein [Runella sp. SP2]|uniref:hypothetical protein n=1 Tax=Runella sp. SP2 TaxID=2268026 RepID=UPI000F09826A|nr:hypothetical protein [Runella sp. SP2]AYQ31416.1 hypothetical protein DTQ70_04130 [Runella sp. SP2]